MAIERNHAFIEQLKTELLVQHEPGHVKRLRDLVFGYFGASPENEDFSHIHIESYPHGLPVVTWDNSAKVENQIVENDGENVHPLLEPGNIGPTLPVVDSGATIDGPGTVPSEDTVIVGDGMHQISEVPAEGVKPEDLPENSVVEEGSNHEAASPWIGGGDDLEQLRKGGDEAVHHDAE